MNSASDRGLRRIKMDKNFFTGYRKNIVKPDEVLISILIPYTAKVIQIWLQKFVLKIVIYYDFYDLITGII